MEPADHFPVIFAEAAFVSRGPGEDAGVVFIPVVGPLDPFQIGRQPLCLVSDPRLVPLGIIAGAGGKPGGKAVGLNVGFQHHIEAHPVAQLQELRAGGIVRGTDAVDVQLLHPG